jgi:hypothetical protein
MREGALGHSMRALLLLSACLVLAGCNSVSRLDSDSFEAHAVTIGQFEADAQACTELAQAPLDSDPRLIDATRYAKNRFFNSAFSRCMTDRGHRPRPYYKNWLPAVGPG